MIRRGHLKRRGRRGRGHTRPFLRRACAGERGGMHARLSRQPGSGRGSSSSTATASPIARFSLVVGSNTSESTGAGWTRPRKSICEPIYEEPASDLPAQDHLEIYKRQHRSRIPLTRTQSAPQLISTTTTRPVHIGKTVPAIMDSLMPRSESTRLRGQSQLDFKTATTGVAAKAMRNEISNLVRSVSDPQTKKVRPRPLAPSVALIALLAPLAPPGLRHGDAVVLLPLHALPREACPRSGPVRCPLRSLASADASTATGIVSRLPARTRLSLTPSSLRVTPRTLTSSPCSRSMAVSVLPWVRSSGFAVLASCADSFQA